MQFIAYYSLYCIIWILTRLPLRVLYGMSSFIFFLIYYIIPYRKRLVLKNLRNSFPDWEEKEIKKTAREFYRFLCDIFLESSILPFLKEEEVMARFRYKNPEFLDGLYDKGKSVILVFGHYANWELSSTMPRYVKHKITPVYKALHNVYFDRMFIRARSRFGAEMIEVEKSLRTLSEFAKSKVLHASYFIADQRPLMKNIQYWTTFLHQDTPVMLGPEKLAKKFDFAVVFLKINRVRRGFYECEFSLISDDARNTKEYEITDKFFSLLEKQITEAPAYWLWTHNRWKHNKEEYFRRYGHREEIKAGSGKTARV
ncbi:MAG: lysophospholipid acyltransferase family protein [Bacteroidales bacterium]|nr:lysophospholipid acyltransferase family protein [Bacteroidales bacterium]